MEEIRNYFSTEDFKKDISSREVIKIAISVRCGDDYISKGYPICDKEYYMHSIQFIEKNVSARSSIYYSQMITKKQSAIYLKI